MLKMLDVSEGLHALRSQPDCGTALQDWAMVPVCLPATACCLPGQSHPVGIPLIFNLAAAAELLEQTLQDATEGKPAAADILQVGHSHPQALV